MPAAVLIADEAGKQSLLHAVLVGLDHLLDHLAADGAGFPGGQVTVVTVLQIHAHLPWCPFYILNSPNTGTVEGI